MINNDITRNHLVTRRTFLLQTSKMSLFFLLISRIFYLQLYKGSDYKILSDKNRLSLILLPSLRGMILDRYGVVIAENKSCFLIKIDKRLEKNYIKSAERLFDILDLEQNIRNELLLQIKKTNKRLPITLIKNASWPQIAKVEENIILLPGIYVEQSQIRDYHIPLSFAHITGYVGKISEDELMGDGAYSSMQFNVGKSGLEKHYEKNLVGEIGYKKIEIDARGLYIREIERQEAINGTNLELNIDARLQEFIYGLLPEEGGSALVMNIENGDLVSCVSKRAFDPNEFASGISSKSWAKVRNDSYKPLINKICCAQYPPGSPFKLITILASLEAGVSTTQKFNCRGFIELGHRRFSCWKKEGHGYIDMTEAIKQSCNCYMFNISKIIKVDKILEVARRFGFGEKTGIDLPHELPGFIPDTAWRIKNFKFDWNLGDSFNIAIGQGPILVTPIQLGVMASSFASGKTIVRPRIARDAAIVRSNLDISSHHMDFIKDAMRKTVNEPGGSAFYNRSSILNFAGKTGTSQVICKKNAQDDLSRSSIAWERRNHALFSGFFPAQEPKYAVSIIIDHGGAGARVASPIARKIVEFCHSYNV